MARYGRNRFPPGFQWDPRKYDANLKKWKVRFEIAAQVFGDPLSDEQEDLRFPYDESRFVIVGEADGELLYVAFTLRGTDDGSRISSRHEGCFLRKGELMAKRDLSFSSDERDALDMTEEEMKKGAKSDPDARPMTDEMLARAEAGRRVRRGKEARIIAARRLIQEATRDETADT